MTREELKQQFDRCLKWNDPQQWEELALQYYQRGYFLNALHCFMLADKCKTSV